MFSKSLRSKLRQILLFLALSFSVAQMRAQNSFSPGEIAFTGYNSVSNGNGFSFVIQKAIWGGIDVKFTDIGWNPATQSLPSSSTEGVLTWTSGETMQAYTEVTIWLNPDGKSVKSVSSGRAALTGTMALSDNGDQVLAFVGSQQSPSFVAAIHCNYEVANGYSYASSLSAWDDILTSGGWSYNANRSGIPPGLTNGSTAVMVVSGNGPYTEFDAVKYNCTGSNRSGLSSFINNRNNWTMNDTGVTLPSNCNFNMYITHPLSDVTACAFGNAVFNVTASSAETFYWQENRGHGFVDLSNSGIYSGVNTETLTISGVTASMSGYTYRVIVNNFFSNVVTLTVNTPGIWLGTQSTSWSDPSNWTCSMLPNRLMDLTVPSDTPFSPVIDTPTAEVKNITIASGASLGFAGTGPALHVYGELSAIGTFNASGGKIVFSGSTQAIPALTYDHLQISGGAGKTLAGDVTVEGRLTLTSGHVFLGSSNLIIGGGGSITSAHINSFIVTDGTGGLIQKQVGVGGRTGNVTFPIGINAFSYTPAYLNNASGVADNFKVRVINKVYPAYDTEDHPSGMVLENNVVDRTWLVTEETTGGSNATLSVQWNCSDELIDFDNTRCMLSHYSNGTWRNMGAPATAIGFDPFFISASGITSFSPFGVGSIGSPLPVHLVAFAGRAVNSKVVLNWTTAEEINVDKFVVERASDAVTYEKVGEVKAQNRQLTRMDYTFADEGAAYKNWYYRLKMLDLDGTVAYSKAIAVSASDHNTGRLFTVYPNPVPGDHVFIRAPHGTVRLQLTITNMAGVVCYRKDVAVAAKDAPVSVDVKTLPAGIYVLQISNGNSSEQFKLVR